MASHSFTAYAKYALILGMWIRFVFGHRLVSKPVVPPNLPPCCVCDVLPSWVAVAATCHAGVNFCCKFYGIYPICCTATATMNKNPEQCHVDASACVGAYATYLHNKLKEEEAAIIARAQALETQRQNEATAAAEKKREEDAVAAEKKGKKRKRSTGDR
eukprot:TRINITY_DN52617_c0_g1_i1.p1 TRINITY_DN52617_c0_g1~~TRINITY_DN52617_c0_g1_i1.p1  ORF type:complete len:177 (+),score=21.34 TRINITY_DN52617_c0_g1_i1:57-533(+)